MPGHRAHFDVPFPVPNFHSRSCNGCPPLLLWGDNQNSASDVNRSGKVVLKPYCGKTITPRLPSTERKWGEFQFLFALNADGGTDLNRPSHAWDMDDG